MLRAEKAALNGVQSSEGVSHSPKKGIDKNLSRANNIGDLRNEFYNALTKSEWNTFYQRITDSGALVSAIGDVFYTEIGNKLIVAKRQSTQTKDAHDFLVTDVYESISNESYIWNEILQELEGKNYDARRVQAKFAQAAALYGESGLLRKYDGSSSLYVDFYANSGRQSEVSDSISSNNRVFSDRKGSILENEQDSVSDNGVSDNKFGRKQYSAKRPEIIYFRRAQTNGDIYEATINVAKTKDGGNVLYDINQIKRIGHGDVFSKGNMPQGTRNKIPNSVGIISNSTENVNESVSYSAKRPEIISRYAQSRKSGIERHRKR